MGRQRQLTVDDNTEVASGVRDGDASAEHQDVMAVDLVQQLTRTEPQQLRLGRVQPESARTQPGVDVRYTCSQFLNLIRVNQASALVECTPLHGPVQFAIHRGVRFVWHIFSTKLPLTLRGSSPPRNMFLGPTASRSVQQFLYGSQMLCCTMHCCDENPKISPYSWDFVTVSEKDRATAISNMHKCTKNG